jgi:hypothetical protein
MLSPVPLNRGGANRDFTTGYFESEETITVECLYKTAHVAPSTPLSACWPCTRQSCWKRPARPRHAERGSCRTHKRETGIRSLQKANGERCASPTRASSFACSATHEPAPRRDRPAANPATASSRQIGHFGS